LIDISEKEWRQVKEVIRVLKPFEILITQFCGSRYVTISLVFPTIRNLINSARLMRDSIQDEFLKDLYVAMCTDLEARFTPFRCSY